MKQITLEIPDELADRLQPYRDDLAQIIQLGLGQVEGSTSAPGRTSRERATALLREGGLARPLEESIAQRYVPELEHHIRTGPVKAGGQPASEWIVEVRGSRL